MRLQFFTDRSYHLAQIKYLLMLRWRRFCRHSGVIETLYPHYKVITWSLSFIRTTCDRRRFSWWLMGDLFCGVWRQIIVLHIDDLSQNKTMLLQLCKIIPSVVLWCFWVAFFCRTNSPEPQKDTVYYQNSKYSSEKLKLEKFSVCQKYEHDMATYHLFVPALPNRWTVWLLFGIFSLHRDKTHRQTNPFWLCEYSKKTSTFLPLEENRS